MNVHRPHRLAGTQVAPAADLGFSPVPGSAATKMPCLECDGVGEVDVLALDAVRSCIEYCSTCDGTGLVAPYCTICEATLVNGICFDCDLPSGGQLAERSALGMPGVAK